MTLLTMSPGAHRALAAKWFLMGFKMSGRQFHGENYDAAKYPSLVSLLLSEFHRVYNSERQSRQDQRDRRRAVTKAAQGNGSQ